MNRYLLVLLVALSACGRTSPIGEPPAITPKEETREHSAMMSEDIPLTLEAPSTGQLDASLWTKGRGSLLGDRRAMRRGDIMTVVIEIDDRAEISNSSERSRSGSEKMAVSSLFGLAQRANAKLPQGASLDPAVALSSNSESQGDGSVRRKEKLTLRVAATIVDILPNGVLSISGSQEVRVNFEVRELLVSGFVRPEDVSRMNEITYDKIASARISYGGRGQISDVQQPRYGQQVADTILPF